MSPSRTFGAAAPAPQASMPISPEYADYPTARSLGTVRKQIQKNFQDCLKKKAGMSRGEFEACVEASRSEQQSLEAECNRRITGAPATQAGAAEVKALNRYCNPKLMNRTYQQFDEALHLKKN